MQIACFLVGADTSSGSIFAATVPVSKKMDMPYVIAGTSRWGAQLRIRTFFVFTVMEKEFFSCFWTKLPENVVLKDKIETF